MIRIGFGLRQKENIINNYIAEHGIKQVFVLYAREQEQKLRISMPYETVEYRDWEMYKVFYPMIEKVDGDTLIVVNDALRTTVYQDLKVNCATVWLNQTPHRIIFNEFPFIEDKEDFRILQKLDQAKKQVDKFDYSHLQTQDIIVKPIRVKMQVIEHKTTEKEKEKYEAKKIKIAEKIEDSVSKDPDNLPRKLQIEAGNFKKKLINSDKFYLARNQRFKLDNVDSIKSFDAKKNYIFIDLPTTRKELIDYMMSSKKYTIRYISTDLSIDTFLVTDFAKWKARLDAFYGKANIYK